MRKLTTKTKIGIHFSLVSITILLVTAGVFMITFYKLSIREVKSQLLHEAQELITKHLSYEGKRVVYRNDENGNSISSDLISDDASAVIYNQDLKQIGNFGVFQFKSDLLEKFTDANHKQLAQDVKTSEKYIITYDDQLYTEKQYSTITYPILNNGEFMGIIQVTTRVEQVQSLVSYSLLLILSILPIAVLVSFWAGRRISRQAFAPIRTLLRKMNNINSHNLHGSVPTSGNPKDEIVQLAKTFNNMLDRINMGIKKQKDFVSNASHELNTPLTRAISTLDILAMETKKDQNTQQKLILVKNDLTSLTTVLQSLLFLSQVLDSCQVAPEKIDLNALVKLTVKEYAVKAKSKKLNVSIKVPDKIIKVKLVKEYLHIILTNLISNSIKYHNTGGKIKISLEANSNKTCSLTVADNGKGMSAKEQKHLFERFSRGSQAHLQATGAGLGMSIVKAVCDLYGLNIKVESKSGKGTVIIISNIPTEA